MLQRHRFFIGQRRNKTTSGMTLIHGIHATAITKNRIVRITKLANNITIRGSWDSRVVQQFHHSTLTKWHYMTMPGPCMAYALIRPMHRGPTVNDIFPKLLNAQYLTLIDASPAYHNFKLDKISYLTLLSCQFDRYRFTRLRFRIVPAGDKFQWNIYENFKELPNIFGIEEYILLVGHDIDGRDHNRTLMNSADMWTRKPETNKNKCYFRSSRVPFCVR